MTNLQYERRGCAVCHTKEIMSLAVTVPVDAPCPAWERVWVCECCIQQGFLNNTLEPLPWSGKPPVIHDDNPLPEPVQLGDQHPLPESECSVCGSERSWCEPCQSYTTCYNCLQNNCECKGD